MKIPLIKLAKENSSDTIDIGFYGLYNTSGTQDLYTGLFRDTNDNKFKLFTGLEDEPTTTVNISGNGYTTATLVSNIEGNVIGNVTGNLTGNADTVTNGIYTSSSVTDLSDVDHVGSGSIITTAERNKLNDIEGNLIQIELILLMLLLPNHYDYY